MSIVVRLILPFACAWVRYQESTILKRGVPLSPGQIQLATRLGILYPERIRLRVVSKVPPLNWLLRFAGEKLGVVSGQTIGMTLRYGIFVREEHWGDRRLLTHELAHVAQYERLGGIRGFLKQYLEESINPGYPLGDLELEAKAAESLASTHP
ncbi:MAG TPA: hypothetical protein VKY92_08030 [Verrucomicrobiae bacterium]|nr:hypothetical protein [Verrucomicrobiae bacterium]